MRIVVRLAFASLNHIKPRQCQSRDGKAARALMCLSKGSVSETYFFFFLPVFFFAFFAFLAMVPSVIPN